MLQLDFQPTPCRTADTMSMSWNVSWLRTLRMIVVAGLLLALLWAVLSSIGTRGQPWGSPGSADAPKTPRQPATGMMMVGTAAHR
jgi:hypothetical protein